MWVPFAGSAKDLSCGILTGSMCDVTCGLCCLGVDVCTFGCGSAVMKGVSATAKAVKAGQKGASLAKAAKEAKKSLDFAKQFGRGLKAFFCKAVAENCP